MSLIDKLKKEIEMNPMELLGKKLEVDSLDDEVIVYPKPFKETMAEMMDDNVDDIPVEWVKED